MTQNSASITTPPTVAAVRRTGDINQHEKLVGTPTKRMRINQADLKEVSKLIEESIICDQETSDICMNLLKVCSIYPLGARTKPIDVFKFLVERNATRENLKKVNRYCENPYELITLIRAFMNGYDVCSDFFLQTLIHGEVDFETFDFPELLRAVRVYEPDFLGNYQFPRSKGKVLTETEKRVMKIDAQTVILEVTRNLSSAQSTLVKLLGHVRKIEPGVSQSTVFAILREKMTFLRNSNIQLLFERAESRYGYFYVLIRAFGLSVEGIDQSFIEDVLNGTRTVNWQDLIEKTKKAGADSLMVHYQQ